MTADRKRIWGWMFFDWAQQPYATLGLTFIFSPYFAAVAALAFVNDGSTASDASARAQSLWSAGQTIAGLFIAVTAPFIGAWADASGRKLSWIAVFSLVYVVCFWSLWWLLPDGTGLIFTLVMFWIGFVAAESALNINNAMLPSLGPDDQIGRISGSAAAFGYWGGVIALFAMLLLFDDGAGKTLIGLDPGFGFLDAEAREGTRSVGPFIVIWFVIFIIPFFLWNREPPVAAAGRASMGQVWANLKDTAREVFRRRSLGNFLLGSMLYRDALNAVYSFGGIYAALVLGWETIQIGVFGIVAAIAAAILTWVGGLADQRLGPKPVIVASCWVLIAVSTIIVGMSRESLFGFPLPEGSLIPDIIFYVCGGLLGGAGGAVYSASRTMMVRHAHPDRPGEAFGLFALTGKATAFLAPALITVFTLATGSNQLGFLPVIALFLIGLFLLRFVDKDGDRAEWSARLPQSR
jgi:MFS transporter, UMF1 family